MEVELIKTSGMELKKRDKENFKLLLVQIFSDLKSKQVQNNKTAAKEK